MAKIEEVKAALLQDPEFLAKLVISDTVLRAQVVKRLASDAAFDGTVESAVAKKMKQGLFGTAALAVVAAIFGLWFPFKNFYEARDALIAEFNQSIKNVASTVDDARVRAAQAQADARDAQGLAEQAKSAAEKAQESVAWAKNDDNLNAAKKIKDVIDAWTPDEREKFNALSDIATLKQRTAVTVGDSYVTFGDMAICWGEATMAAAGAHDKKKNAGTGLAHREFRLAKFTLPVQFLGDPTVIPTVNGHSNAEFSAWAVYQTNIHANTLEVNLREVDNGYDPEHRDRAIPTGNGTTSVSYVAFGKVAPPRR